MTLRHVVLFSLAATDRALRREQAAALERELTSLPARIPEIRALQVALNTVEQAGNADVVLVLDVDGPAELATYQTHPAHRAAIAGTGHLLGGRTAIDYEV